MSIQQATLVHGIGRFWPVYSLDGLGANDPPIITINWGASSVAESFTYAPPTDPNPLANSHRGVVVMMASNTGDLGLGGTGSMSLEYDGNALGNLSAESVSILSGSGSPSYLHDKAAICYGTIYGGSGDAWTITRVSAVAGATVWKIRIYTFANFNIAVGGSSGGSFDLSADGGVATTNPFDLPFLSPSNLVFNAATRDVVSANFLITSPGDFTYSPTGHDGEGALDGGSTQTMALEFKFEDGPVSGETNTWTFASPGVGEGAFTRAIAIIGAFY